MNRQQTNIVLVKTLGMLIEKYPDMRFGQILFNFGFIDHDKATDFLTIQNIVFGNYYLHFAQKSKPRVERVVLIFTF